MTHHPESASSEVRWFQWICWGFAAVPLMLGSTIALTGGAGLALVFGLDLGEPGPSLESHIRFLAANFAAMGLVLVWSTRDVVALAAGVRIVLGAMIVGAVIRLLTIGLYGPPSTMTMLVIGGELTAGPLWLWHTRILRLLRPPT